ncbi:MAG: PDZ domain-containing protein [Candidatus Zixiibacteriota bacterium]|nr:MAG: PDZ domain-containing protein [candidate division Zixibacteria bacterium]
MRDFLKVFAVVVLVVAVMASFGVTRSEKSSKYAWLGILGQTVDEDMADAFDLAVERGAIVNEVLDDSPAEKAGLEDGDVIIEFAGVKIGDYDDLLDVLEDHKPGDQVTVKIDRDGDQLEKEVMLEGRPRGYRSKWWYPYVIHAPRTPTVPRVMAIPRLPKIPKIPKIDQIYIHGGEMGGAYLGVVLTDLGEQLGEYFGVEGGRGALVMEVEEDSPAAEAGLKAGDVIVRVDGAKIYDREDVHREIIGDKEEGDTVEVVVIRDRAEMTFSVEVENSDFDWSDDAYIYKAPDIDIRIPDIKGLRHGVYLDNLHGDLDLEDLEDLVELEQEMQELRRELKEMQLEDTEDLREELEELREDLEDLEKRLD